MKYIIFLLFISNISFAVTTVSLIPSSSIISLGQSFTIDIIMDTDQDILSWGLDINFDSNFLTLTNTAIQSPWIQQSTGEDSDGLEALAFPAQTGISTLARLTFTAIDITSNTNLFLSVTETDSAEQFFLAGLPGSVESDLTFIDTNVEITAVPEPISIFGSVLVILLGFLKRKVK